MDEYYGGTGVMGAYAGPTQTWGYSNLSDSARFFASTKLVVQSGLVLNLDAGVSSSYPGSGTTWTDLSGGGNNGTLTNGPTYSSSNGGSIDFDGVNDFASTPYVFPSSSSHTFSVWAKSASASVTNRPIGNADSGAGLTGTSIIWGFPTSSSVYIVRRAGANASTYDCSGTLTGLSSGWHNICVTYSHTGVGTLAYGDNNVIASNGSLAFDGGDLTINIGKDGNGSDAFDGNIAHVTIYNRALSAAEVTQNFNALRGRYGI